MAAACVSPETSVLLDQAKHAHMRSNLRAAAEAYRQVLLVAPAHPAALLGLSLIARQAGQPESALRLALNAVAASPLSALVWSNLGDIQLASQLAGPLTSPEENPRFGPLPLDHAQSSFHRALAIDPHLSAAHFGLGNVHAQRDDYAAALTHFRCAAALAPKRADLAFALAFTHGDRKSVV